METIKDLLIYAAVAAVWVTFWLSVLRGLTLIERPIGGPLDES